MKRKKGLLVTIGAYVTCLLVVIGLFVIYNTKENNKSIVNCYIATSDIAEGTIMDESVLASTIKQDTTHNSYKEKNESYGNNLVVETSKIVNKQTVTFIPAGTILTDKLFQPIKSEIVYEGYHNAQYITMPVTAESVPAEGFEINSNISVIGLMSLSDLSQIGKEETVSYSDDTWVGVITSKALVYSVTTDDTEMITNVTLVVEKDVYPTLIIAANNAKVFYLKGEVNDISEVQSDVVNSIFETTGLSTLKTDMNIKVTTTNLSDRQSYAIPMLENGELKHLPIYVIGESNSIILSWTGNAVYAMVQNYQLSDGEKGEYYGTYSYSSNETTKKICYDINTEEHYFYKPFEKEGYYEIEYFDKNKISLGKTIFVVESTKQSWVSTNNEVKILLEKSFENERDMVKPEDYAIEYSLVKPYFSKIEKLINYSEKITLDEDILNNSDKIEDMKFIIDEKDTIGSFLGEEIIEINLVKTIDGIKSVMPLVYRTKFETIDYSVSNSQIIPLTDSGGNIVTLDLTTLLGCTSLSLGTYIVEYGFTYSSLQILLDKLISMRKSDDILDPNVDNNYMQKMLRYLITKEKMTKEDFNYFYKTFYQVNDFGVSSKKNNTSLQIQLVLENKEIFNLDLTLIYTEFDASATPE